MSNRQVMSDIENGPGEVSELLAQGLDLYGHNDVDGAIRCWRRALALDPSNAKVRDYLECAGAPLEQPATVVDLEAMRAQLGFAPGDDGTPGPAEVRVSDDDHEPHPVSERVRKSEIEQLLRDSRYEEALELLYQVRARRPHDVGLSRSIRLLRERLALSYAQKLKNLDLVPVLDPTLRGGSLGAEERVVAGLVDSVSSFGDIVASCTLGRLLTLRILCTFVEQGVVRALSNTPHFDTQISGELPSAWPRSVEPRSVEPGSVEPRSVEPRSVEPRSVEPRSVEPRSVEPRSVGHAAPTSVVPPPPPPPVAPPSSAGPPKAAPSKAAPSDYELLFSEATQAYLIRDYRRAAELFARCCEQRPDDRRARHNLKALQRRLQSP